MSLFAASLDTLKKRTTQLLDGLDKGKEGGSRSPDIQEPSVEIPYDAQVSQALGCPDDSILVRYEVQNAEDKDTELTLYSMPLSGAVSITLAMVRSSFPVPGRYHLRFKAPTSDGSFGGWVWIDLTSDTDFVPVFNGGLSVKALKLPDDVGSAPLRAPPFAPSGHSGAYAQSAMPAARGADLMELDLGAKKPSPPAPAPKPAVKLDRAQLVADRQAREKQEYEDKIRRHEEIKQREAQSKKEKAELNDVLSKEMTDWAKTPDGQSYKEIRTLLSTMHAVMWEGAGWQPLSLSELVADSSIKKHYRKAILMAHPDRHQSASSEQQVRADRIFNALNESFKAFNS